MLLAAFTVALSLVHFQSPSGNINCIGAPAGFGQPAFVQCLVRKHTWPASITPRKPASCDLDFDPYTVSLGNRKVSVGLMPRRHRPALRLHLGQVLDARVRPVGEDRPDPLPSATAGVTCRYTTSPRAGFRIAREGYVTYRS